MRDASVSAPLSRLHTRLVLIALAAVLPAIAAIAWVASIGRHAAVERAVAGNLGLTRLAASQLADVFDDTQRLLLTLAEFPALRAHDSRGCEEMLPKILRGHSDYVNIKVADADGSLFCTAAPVDPRLFPHIRDGVWFERAKRARATAVGDYQISAT